MISPSGTDLSQTGLLDRLGHHPSAVVYVCLAHQLVQSMIQHSKAFLFASKSQWRARQPLQRTEVLEKRRRAPDETKATHGIGRLGVQSLELAGVWLLLHMAYGESPSYLFFF